MTVFGVIRLHLNDPGVHDVNTWKGKKTLWAPFLNILEQNLTSHKFAKSQRMSNVYMLKPEALLSKKCAHTAFGEILHPVFSLC